MVYTNSTRLPMINILVSRKTIVNFAAVQRRIWNPRGYFYLPLARKRLGPSSVVTDWNRLHQTSYKVSCATSLPHKYYINYYDRIISCIPRFPYYFSRLVDVKKKTGPNLKELRIHNDHTLLVGMYYINRHTINEPLTFLLLFLRCPKWILKLSQRFK